MRRALVLAALVALTAQAGATAVTPSASLRAAWRRGDSGELGRAANRLGARGLAAAITGGVRPEVLAAIAAAPHADESWTLLEPLAARAGDHDRPIAAAAALAALAILRAHPLEDLLRRGAPVDELDEIGARFAELASRPLVWADVRVHALEAALALSPAASPLPVALLADADPELRRAAIVFADAEAATVAARLAELAAGDEDVAVAASAAAALCRAGMALSDAARARAGKIADDPLVDPGDVSSLRACAPR